MLWETLKSIKSKWRVLVLAGMLSLLFLVPLAQAALRSVNTRSDSALGQQKNTPSCPASPLVGPPTNKNQCKNGGWRTFNVPRCFKSEGDCVSFVETGK
jgi:hypothetical protein